MSSLYTKNDTNQRCRPRLSGPTTLLYVVAVEFMDDRWPLVLKERVHKRQFWASFSKLVPFVAICANIILSGGLVLYNQFLMTKGRFPYPAALTGLHQSAVGGLVYWVYSVKGRSWFPAAPDSLQNAGLIAKGIFPIGMLNALSLVVSNYAYVYSSLSFLQMMKVINTVLVFLTSWVLGLLDKFRIFNFGLILTISVAAAFTIDGELQFSSNRQWLNGVLRKLFCFISIKSEL